MRAENATPPLRIGLLVDSLQQPAWVEHALRRVVDTNAGSIVAVIRNVSDSTGPTPSRLRRWYRSRKYLLHAAYMRFDRWRFRASNDPFEPRDISALVADATVLEVRPRRTRFSDIVEPADVESIERLQLDVLVRLGFRILRGGILRAARFGVLSYHHGDNERYRGGPPAFWEVMEGQPVTGAMLQVLTEDLDAGHVVYRSHVATHPLSVTRNRHALFWKSAAFLPRVLSELRECGVAALTDAAARSCEPAAYSAPLYVVPTNVPMVRSLAGVAKRYVGAKVRSLVSTDQWFMAYRFRRDAREDNRVPDLVPYRFQRLMPPADRFWADPFPLRVGERYFVVFEEYLYATRRAHIAAVEVGPNGPIGKPATVLETGAHLSYPFVFQWRGNWWMVPEMVESGRVELYRATEPPWRWTLEQVLFDGVNLVDCTLAEIRGRWWLFGNRADPGSSPWDELDLYHADSPLGPWIPHRRNPVVTDVRRARPAGAPFEWNGAWYRPSQDCAGSYGRAINIQRIDILDERRYVEHPVTRLEPFWSRELTGTHTVNALGPLTVIDARWRRPRWPIRPRR